MCFFAYLRPPCIQCKEGRYSSLAQSVERLTVNQDVTGSSPVGGAKNPANKSFAGFLFFAECYDQGLLIERKYKIKKKKIFISLDYLKKIIYNAFKEKSLTYIATIKYTFNFSARRYQYVPA